MSIKVYKGGSFVDANFIRRYNGSSWIDISGGKEFVQKSFTVTSGPYTDFINTDGKTDKHPALIITNPGFTPVTVCAAIEVADYTTWLGNQSSTTLRLVHYHWSGSPMKVTSQYPINTLPSFNKNKIVVPVYLNSTSHTLFVFGYK